MARCRSLASQGAKGGTFDPVWPARRHITGASQLRLGLIGKRRLQYPRLVRQDLGQHFVFRYEKEYLIDLEDACVVEREKGGKIHIKQAVNLTLCGVLWWVFFS
jgi:hypothetical protein